MRHIAGVRERRGLKRILMRKLRERDHLEDAGVDGRITQRWIFSEMVSMELIVLAQDRQRWRAFVKAVVKVWVPQNAGNFLNSLEPVSYSRRTLLHEVSK